MPTNGFGNTACTSAIVIPLFGHIKLIHLDESKESLSLARSKGPIWVFSVPKASLNSHRVEYTVVKEFLATLHIKLEQVLSIKKILNPAHIYFSSSLSGHKATISVSSFPGSVERVKDNLFFISVLSCPPPILPPPQGYVETDFNINPRSLGDLPVILLK